MGRRWRYARLRLHSADELQSKTAGEIRPAVVVGNKRNAAQRRKPLIPVLQPALEAREEGKPVARVDIRVSRIDARKRRQDVAGDDLGIVRIEPVVRIAAAVRMSLAADAQPAHIERRDTK